jgi:folate-binding protein YgfZ
MPDSDVQHEYEALTRGGGFVDLGERTLIELFGPDRAAFLHNFCTNEIRKLPIGGGCEAFITNVQGKVLAHFHVWDRPESLIIETVGGLGEKLVAHLDRYLIREQVQIVDRSQESGELLLAGPQADAVLKWSVLPYLEPRRVEIVKPLCYLLYLPRGSVGEVAKSLAAGGAVACSKEALEMARLEAGFPWQGHDITDEPLAPEVGRDRQAISYVKGCYLGQETIARIDALGHVNRLLVGVAFDSADVPAIGTELRAGDKTVGHVTSAAFSPRLNQPLALAYIRRGHNEPGSRLSSACGEATVVKLPLE